MVDIYDIFSSRAKVKILRTLYFRQQAAPLRHIAYISELPIFSVQNAIGSLLKDKIVRKRRKENLTLFELNKKNSLYAILEQFFVMEMQSRICMEVKKYFQKAKQALEFASEANTIFWGWAK